MNWSVLEGSDTAAGSAVIADDQVKSDSILTGKNCLKMTYQGNGIYGIISDPIATAEGKEYRLNLMAQGLSGDDPCHTYLNFYNEEGTLISSSTDWSTGYSNGRTYITTNGSDRLAITAPAGAVTVRQVIQLGTEGTATDVSYLFDRATIFALDSSVTSVPNGNFESGWDSAVGLPYGYDLWEWSDSYKAQIELATDIVHTGKNSMKMTASQGSYQAAVRSGLVAVEPNVSYDFYAYIYNVQGNAPILRVQFYDKNGSAIGSVTDVSSTSANAWAQSSKTIAAPSNAAFATIMMYQNRSASSKCIAYVDDITVIKTSENIPETPISTTLQNAGFENGFQTSGLPNNWVVWPNNAAGKIESSTTTVHNTTGYTGTTSVKITDDSTSATAGIASEPVQVTAGKKYRATAWVYNESGIVSLYMNFYGNRENALADSGRIPPVPNITCSTVGKWTLVTIEGTAPAGATCATVGFYMGVGSTAVSYADDLTFGLVPDVVYGSQILNPDFEGGTNTAGVPSNWTLLSASDEVLLSNQYSTSGNYSGNLINDSSTGCGLRSSGVAVTPGVNYQAKSNMYCKMGYGEIYLEFWNAAGSRIDVKTVTNSRTKEWREVSVEGIAPANAAYATLLYYQNSGNPGVIYVDDASIAPYTAPETEIRNYSSVVSSHPKVFFTADDIANLRALAQSTKKSANGTVGKDVVDAIIAEANKLMAEKSYSTNFSAYGSTYTITINNPPTEMPVSPSAPSGYGVWPFWTMLGRGIQNRLEVLSMAYMLTGDTAYSDSAIQFLDAMCGWELWHDPKDGYPTQKTNLDTAHIVQGAAIVYDVCYDQLTEAQREKFCNAIIKLGLEPLYQDGLTKTDHNIQGVRNSALATGALAILGDVDRSITNKYLTCAVDYFNWYLNEKYESGNQEGFGYTAYAIENIVMAFDQIARVTGDNSLIRHEYFEDLLIPWLITFCAPGSLTDAPVSNHDAEVGFFATVSALAQNGNGLAAWYLCNAKPGSGDTLNTQKFLSICDPDTLTITQPKTVINNSSIVEKIGWGALRTGWSAQDSLFTLISNQTPLGHNHFDQNSFLIATNGSWLASDPGYSTFDNGKPGMRQFRDKVGHNTILVDWVKNTTTGAQVYKGGGQLTSDILTNNYGAIIGSAADSYGVGVLNQYDRHAIMLNHADHPYYVLFDELDSDEARTYSWSLFTDGWDSLKIDGNAVSGETVANWVIPCKSTVTLPISMSSLSAMILCKLTPTITPSAPKWKVRIFMFPTAKRLKPTTLCLC